MMSSAALAGAMALSQNAVHADQIAIKGGDTLSALAPQYHTTVDALAKANNLTNPNLIVVGQKLSTSGSDSLQKPNVVIVKAGDTLGKIAEENNTDVPTLKKNNGLTSDLIYVGQKLTISPSTNQNQQNASGAPTNPTQTAEMAISNGATQSNETAQQSTNSYQGIRTYQPVNPQQATSNSNYSSNATGNEAAAKAWIAGRESGGNYSARNGQYIGKYQLSSSYLNGDYSAANQERAADQYVASRYGSWTNAQRFWQSNGWY